jgi:hypothetical protein
MVELDSKLIVRVVGLDSDLILSVVRFESKKTN